MLLVSDDVPLLMSDDVPVPHPTLVFPTGRRRPLQQPGLLIGLELGEPFLHLVPLNPNSYGPVPGDGRKHHEGRIRALRGAGPGAVAFPGQVVVADNLAAQEGERGSGSRSRDGAARSCSCRRTRRTSRRSGGVLEGQGAAPEGRCSYPRGDRAGARRGDGPRREGLVRPLRLPARCSTVVRTAMGRLNEWLL